MISIIIATKNRPDKLSALLISLGTSQFRQFEVIVSDQGTPQATLKSSDEYHIPQLFHIKCTHGGKSVALNTAINMAHGEILAFTDDDCIAPPLWLQTIGMEFKQSNIDAVFGKTVPYERQKHRNHVCPAIFSNNKPALIVNPCTHYDYIGFGNNMAIRKKPLIEIGGFREWLGPGSIGQNCEDGDVSLRLLLHKKRILFTPTVVMYHNRWLTPKKAAEQDLIYTCGEMACYGYFHFQGHQFATPVVFSNIRESYHKTKIILKRILFMQWNRKSLTNIYDTGREIIWRGRGLFIGYIYAHIDPIDRTQLHRSKHNVFPKGYA